MKPPAPHAPHPVLHRAALAPMSPLIRGLTILLWLLPAALAAAAAYGAPVLGLPLLLLLALYAAVWLAARPGAFEISPRGLAIVFPVWTRRCADVARARALSGSEFRERFGLALRVGVGGLWGGFGWLWTSRGGWVEFYVSRTDGLVWVERRGGRSLLITPENPEAFVATLNATLGAPGPPSVHAQGTGGHATAS